MSTTAKASKAKKSAAPADQKRLPFKVRDLALAERGNIQIDKVGDEDSLELAIRCKRCSERRLLGGAIRKLGWQPALPERAVRRSQLD